MPPCIACLRDGATAFGSSPEIVIAAGWSRIAFSIVDTWPEASAVVGPT